MTHPVVAASGVGCALNGVNLLKDVSFVLPQGRLTVLVGPNGAGKSTLLRVLAGEFRCSAGHVFYAGQDISHLSPGMLAARRAVMAQATRLAFPFSVQEVVALGIESLGRKFARATRQRLIAEALEQVELRHLAERTYQSLSGGEQQRVQFARALTQIWSGEGSSESRILFLDEPTAHLDTAHQLALMDQVQNLTAQGMTALVTIHDLNLAAAYADHLLVLERGRLVAAGDPADLLSGDGVPRVFGLSGKMNEPAPQGAAFILPHRHAQKQRHTARQTPVARGE